MITKGDIALAALEEVRVSGLTSKATPAEITSVIKKLDRMVLAWQNKGVCLSYIRSESFFDVDPNQDSGLNDTSAHAVILNLSKIICPMFGKPVDLQTSREARSAYLGLFGTELTMRENDPHQPLGSGQNYGYSYFYTPRYQEVDKNAPSDCEIQDLKIGETDSFGIDFNSYLNEIDGETIISYTIDDGEGVEVGDNSELNGVISFYATGAKTGSQDVKVTIITETRTNPETITFNVTEK